MKNYYHIFLHFLRLGCLSFGGPAAHIGYFYQHFVKRHQWIDDATFSHYLALCQFLPGPSSSQLGFAIGLHRAGIFGGVMAFLGFTMPSFAIMYLVAIYVISAPSPIIWLIISALKLTAVAVIFDAILSMSTSFCQQRISKIIALSTTVFLLWYSSWLGQFMALAVVTSIALLYSHYHKHRLSQPQTIIKQHSIKPVSDKGDYRNIMMALLLLLSILCLPLWLSGYDVFAWFAKFFSAGSLVFGGGHVVLPLLQSLFHNEISYESLMTGYAAAQALPGPLFTFATYVGALLAKGQFFYGVSLSLMTALMATLAIFLPGFMLLIMLRRHWQVWAQQPNVQVVVMAINACVVGMLLSVWLSPVVINTVLSVSDAAIVLVCFLLIRWQQWPILLSILATVVLVFLRHYYFN